MIWITTTQSNKVQGILESYILFLQTKRKLKGTLKEELQGSSGGNKARKSSRQSGSSFEQEEVANSRLPRRSSVVAAREPATGQRLFYQKEFSNTKESFQLKKGFWGVWVGFVCGGWWPSIKRRLVTQRKVSSSRRLQDTPSLVQLQKRVQKVYSSSCLCFKSNSSTTSSSPAPFLRVSFQKVPEEASKRLFKLIFDWKK
ncbi:hypothetical protein J6590_043378 [Homalodisca vitripennis]|nr:hypothetical protein J6590_043378 [Homalodisca vitripennis]